jgi:hypothetical protein
MSMSMRRFTRLTNGFSEKSGRRMLRNLAEERPDQRAQAIRIEDRAGAT